MAYTDLVDYAKIIEEENNKITRSYAPIFNGILNDDVSDFTNNSETVTTTLNLDNGNQILNDVKGAKDVDLPGENAIPHAKSRASRFVWKRYQQRIVNVVDNNQGADMSRVNSAIVDKMTIGYDNLVYNGSKYNYGILDNPNTELLNVEAITDLTLLTADIMDVIDYVKDVNTVNDNNNLLLFVQGTKLKKALNVPIGLSGSDTVKSALFTQLAGANLYILPEGIGGTEDKLVVLYKPSVTLYRGTTAPSIVDFQSNAVANNTSWVFAMDLPAVQVMDKSAAVVKPFNITLPSELTAKSKK